MGRKRGDTGSFVSGMVWGGLVGAALGLLMAPGPGEETRQRLREKSEALGERAREAAGETRHRVAELQDRGREMLAEGRQRVSRTVEEMRTPPQATSPSQSAGGPMGDELPRGGPERGGPPDTEPYGGGPAGSPPSV